VQVRNVHERRLRIAPSHAAFLLESLVDSPGSIWPFEAWPRMRFDRPLRPGAVGGHGPIRYVVTCYEPGQMLACRFTAPAGFVGTHWFEIRSDGYSGTLLRHTIEMKLVGRAKLSWPLIFRPMHDALLEDALAKAQRAVGEAPALVLWSAWVRILRAMLRRRGPQSL
jgi:hypothetical protein